MSGQLMSISYPAVDSDSSNGLQQGVSDYVTGATGFRRSLDAERPRPRPGPTVDKSGLLQQVLQSRKRIVGRATFPTGTVVAGMTTIGFDLLLVLVIVAIDAQQLPVAAVRRVVVVVVIAMMNGQFAQVGLCEFTGTTAANPRINLQGTIAIGVGPGIGRFAGSQNDVVETTVIDGFHDSCNLSGTPVAMT